MDLGRRIKALRLKAGLSQAQFAQMITRAGFQMSQKGISKIERGGTERPRGLPEIARVLKVSEHELRTGTAAPVSPPQPDTNPLSQLATFDVALPVSIFSGEPLETGGVRMKLNGRPARKIAAPGQLGGIRGAYGVYIYDDSMSPYAFRGEVAIVDKSRPAVEGDHCLFIGDDHDGTQRVIARQLVGSSSSKWRVKQYHPAKEYDLAKADYDRAHPIQWRGKV